MPQGVRDEHPVYKFRDHALFIAFAPEEAPKIALSVLVEHGGHGSSAAAPKAKAVIEFFLNKVYAQSQVSGGTERLTRGDR